MSVHSTPARSQDGLSLVARERLTDEPLLLQLAGSIALAGTGKPIVRVCRHCGTLASEAAEQNEPLCSAAWPGAHSFRDVDARTLDTPKSPFPFTHDEDATPTVGVWDPRHQLVAHGPGDSLLCTACGEPQKTVLRSMPDSFEHDGEHHLTWWVIPVEADGRCMDCCWMDLPASEQMRHVGLAIADYQLQLDLHAQMLADLRKAA